MKVRQNKFNLKIGFNMYDVECPYCRVEQEINHDDGYGYEEGETFQQECHNRTCGKTFAFTTDISFYYSVHHAPCLNGGEHEWKPKTGYPVEFLKGKFQCFNCGEQKP